MTKQILYYVHDPMCSWCWGFDATRQDLLQRLPAGIEVRRLLGGLAPDSDEPMPMQTRQQVQQNWRAIEDRLPDVSFNFDFWTRCQPKRSTYPACRAVIAAREQDPEYDVAMTGAIQRAYYLEARNPSETATLVALADETGLDAQRFARHLAAPETSQQLLAEIHQSRQMQADSFPSLVLQRDSTFWQIHIDYASADSMLELIETLLDDGG